MKDSERNPNAPRGMGRERFEALLKQRPSKKLKNGDHLLYHHALRCLCQHCGKLLDWGCPAELSYTITKCCGTEYRLMPWTVKIETHEISSPQLLPPLDGSAYSDPDFDLAAKLIGNSNAIKPLTTRPLSRLQQKLGAPSSKPIEGVSVPRTFVIPPKGYLPPTELPQIPIAPSIRPPKQTKIPSRSQRKCSICKKPGHNSRTCPNQNT